jgi:membrane protease YdiL (CAAX protease family)
MTDDDVGNGRGQLPAEQQESRSSSRWLPEGNITAREEEPVGPEDSAIGRVKHGWPGGRVVTNRTLRRFYGWELIVVLAIFPLGSATSAVVALIERIQMHHDLSGGLKLQGEWLILGFTALEEFAFLGAAALVCYLLWRSGEGVRGINLGTSRLRMDLALLLPVFVVVMWAPQRFGDHILPWLHLQGFGIIRYPDLHSRAFQTLVQIPGSVSAGIVEEIVVLGFLVRRLEQRGYNATVVVAIAVAVRVSYHLYYGWNAIPIALWALVSVLVYRRVRRLLPFILCHIAWDAIIPVEYFYPGLYNAMWLVAGITTFVMMLKWARWKPPSAGQPRPTTKEAPFAPLA